jgi:NAD(P)-dependent dehydrogenase (short-subunit alcohol dehydrogenase family)
VKLAGKVAVVTGGGSGIGAALCERFALEGARGIAVVDMDEAAARRVADAITGLALRCDVTIERDLRAVIDQVETRYGAIDLFCSNAGVLANDPDPADPASASDDAWALSWRVHVMSHVYAARHLAPKMAARGSGYLLNTISAAGLLTQLGSGPYSASKHAAVGLAESLAIAYRPRGVGISILCPQGVATPMVAAALTTPAVRDGLLSPQAVAQTVIEGLAAERFLILPHAQVLTYMQRKAADYERWLSGMVRLSQGASANVG